MSRSQMGEGRQGAGITIKIIYHVSGDDNQIKFFFAQRSKRTQFSEIPFLEMQIRQMENAHTFFRQRLGDGDHEALVLDPARLNKKDIDEENSETKP